MLYACNVKCDLLSACLTSVQPEECFLRVFYDNVPLWEKKDINASKCGGSRYKNDQQVFEMLNLFALPSYFFCLFVNIRGLILNI